MVEDIHPLGRLRKNAARIQSKRSLSDAVAAIPQNSADAVAADDDAAQHSAPQYRAFGCYRFLLAVAVVVSHTLSFVYPGPTADLLPSIGLGNVAVMGFFVLSGFVIAEALTTFYRRRPLAFLANRFVRLAPPYWAALVLSLVVHAAILSWGDMKLPDYRATPAGMFDPANLVANLLAIFPRPGRFQIVPEQDFYGFVRFYWAIYIEFAFYIAAFAVALAVMVFARGADRRARFIAVTGTAGGLVLHAVHEYVRPVHWELAYAPYFVAGVCVFAWVARRDRLALVGAAFAHVFMFLHFARYAQGKLAPSSDWIGGIHQAHVATAIALTLATPLALLLLARLDMSSRQRAWDRRLGDLSYPIYLNHYVIVVAFLSLTPADSLLWQAAAVAASIFVSWVLMAAVERPMLPLRDRLRGQAIRA